MYSRFDYRKKQIIIKKLINSKIKKLKYRFFKIIKNKQKISINKKLLKNRLK